MSTSEGWTEQQLEVMSRRCNNEWEGAELSNCTLGSIFYRSSANTTLHEQWSGELFWIFLTWVDWFLSCDHWFSTPQNTQFFAPHSLYCYCTFTLASEFDLKASKYKIGFPHHVKQIFLQLICFLVGHHLIFIIPETSVS